MRWDLFIACVLRWISPPLGSRRQLYLAEIRPTCQFIRNVSVVCQVFSFYQHQLRTFLLCISHRHQLGDPVTSCHIVAGDYDVFLLNTWWFERHYWITKLFSPTSFLPPPNISCGVSVYPEGRLSVKGFWAFPPERRSSPGQNAEWLFHQVLLLMFCRGLHLKQQIIRTTIVKAAPINSMLDRALFLSAWSQKTNFIFNVYRKLRWRWAGRNPRNCYSTRSHPPPCHSRCYPF